MPQKKKTANKKNHKKKHINKSKQNIIIQSLPNFGSSQSSGHQYNTNKNVSFAPPQQSESRTDNLVGDLVSKLINKIETDGSKQTQQYTQEIQPVSNTNSGSNDNTNSGNTSGNTQTVNIYPNSGQTTTDVSSSTVKKATETAITAATGLSAAETAGIAGGVGGGVLAVGGGIFAARKRIGQAIKSAFGGKKLGGNAATSRLVRADDEYVRGTRPGVNTDLQTGSKVKGSYTNLPPNLDPLHEDFFKESMAETRAKLDKIREQARISEHKRTLTTNTLSTQTTPIPTPRQTPRQTPTVTPRNSPTPSLVQALQRGRMQTEISPGYIEPISGVSRARTSGIQRHDGVLTRNLRLQTGEAHTQLESVNRRGRKKAQLQVQTQLSTRNTNPFDGSASETSATELSARQRQITATPARRMRSTMLSQIQTPETNIYVAKSGNKSN